MLPGLRRALADAGPNYAVRDLAWHPLRPLLASVSATGAIYLWARVYRENWSAFAPDFRELQENEVQQGLLLRSAFGSVSGIFPLSQTHRGGLPAGVCGARGCL